MGLFPLPPFFFPRRGACQIRVWCLRSLRVAVVLPVEAWRRRTSHRRSIRTPKSIATGEEPRDSGEQV